MQSIILLAVMALVSIFMAAEMSRNDSTNVYPSFKAGNIAVNIFQYKDSISQYAIANYDELHLPISQSYGSMERIKVIDYTGDKIDKYNQKKLILFLNYKSMIFNYTEELAGESLPMPVLYMATSWDGYVTAQIASSYNGVNMIEVMGKLGEDFSRYLYQGNSTYWTIPWLFSQENCQIEEVYMQLPDDALGISRLDTIKRIFNKFCTQSKTGGYYNFMKYVYIAPVFKTPNI